MTTLLIIIAALIVALVVSVIVLTESRLHQQYLMRQLALSRAAFNQLSLREKELNILTVKRIITTVDGDLRFESSEKRLARFKDECKHFLFQDLYPYIDVKLVMENRHLDKLVSAEYEASLTIAVPKGILRSPEEDPKK